MVVKNTVPNVHSNDPESIILDLYAVGASYEKEEASCKMVPFVHQIRIHGPGGTPIEAWAHFDDGAMKEAMSMKKFQE